MDFIYKHKKILIIFSILIIVILLFILNRFDITVYLSEKGYAEYDEATYYKKISKLTKKEYDKRIKNNIQAEYDYLYFGLGTYHLSEEIGVYDEDVELYYIGEYNYRTGITSYTIRGEYYSTVIQFNGKYNTNNKKFTCKPLLHHDIEYDNDIISTVCNLSKYHTVRLNNKAYKLMDDEEVLNKVVNNTEEE